MYVIGLTGSIGMGKSTVAAMFATCGAAIHDSDKTVHGLYGPGGAAVGPISALIPDAIIGKGRQAFVDRTRLAKAVLNDPATLQTLEDLVHPLVREDQNRFLRRVCRLETRVVVFDIPLLFETASEHRVDATCLVTAPKFVQSHRVLSRPGMTQGKLDRILARQMSDHRKQRLADHVITTGASKGATRRAVMRLYSVVRHLKGHIWPPG